jgi:hypothetical protein
MERGLNVTEVAHDCQLQVSRYVVDELALHNSYDTWHGTKNAAKEISKVCKGTLRSEGKTWFRELSDKKKSTKVRLYWCMKVCGGDCTDLRRRITNIVNHYQGTIQVKSSYKTLEQLKHTQRLCKSVIFIVVLSLTAVAGTHTGLSPSTICCLRTYQSAFTLGQRLLRCV